MKTIHQLLSIALIAGATAAGFQARAGGIGVHLCLPFFSFGIGLGVGGICEAPVYACAAPAYSYAPPAFCGYDCPPSAGDPPARVVSIAAPPAVWVPKTPGVGHWVPDPEPYHYSPAPTLEKKAAAVTVSRSAGGVPVYIIQQQR
jgi:hypothetical protein